MKVDEQVERLSLALTDVEPRHFDFGEGYPERWDFIEAVKCDDCGNAIVNADDHKKKCPRYDRDDAREMYAEGPMMNTWWSLGEGPWNRAGFSWGTVAHDEVEGAKLLVDVPMCIVYDEQTDEWGLAMTGGGMDMTPWIVDAYVLLGFLPPATLRLPRYAGIRWTRETQLRTKALRRSQEVRIQQAQGQLRDLAEYEAWAKENSKRKLQADREGRA